MEDRWLRDNMIYIYSPSKIEFPTFSHMSYYTGYNNTWYKQQFKHEHLVKHIWLQIKHKIYVLE